jgi:hypothetical protein
VAKVSSQASKKRKAIVVISILIYLGVFIYFFIIVGGSYTEVISSPQPQSFQIPFVYNFQSNTTVGFGNPSDNDMQIGLTFYYPQGTLVAGEAVNVSGLVKLNTQQALTVTEIDIGFDNCLQYPITYNNGMAEYGTLHIDNKIADDTIIGNTTITWPIDGDYGMFGVVFYNYGTSNQTFRNTNVDFHVYPQQQLTQIETDKITAILTFALFIFGLVEAIDLCRKWLSPK